MEERRQTKRFKRTLAIEMGDGMNATVEDISTKGLSCRVKDFIEPFSKLRVTINLTDEDQTVRSVECIGVVVRTEPETPAPDTPDYRVAIYFPSMGENCQAQLGHFLDRRESD